MSLNLFREAVYSALDGRADEKDYIDPSVKSRSVDLDFKGVTHDSKTEEEWNKKQFFVHKLRRKIETSKQYHKTNSFNSMFVS